MAKKKEGVELANDIMLKDLAAFLVSKKFYGKELSEEEQQKKAAFDISKRGALRKMLDEAGIKTRYDIAINNKSGNMAAFDIYSKVMNLYRNNVIKKAFQHRKDECK